jgi:hypothetical protein
MIGKIIKPEILGTFERVGAWPQRHTRRMCRYPKFALSPQAGPSHGNGHGNGHGHGHAKSECTPGCRAPTLLVPVQVVRCMVADTAAGTVTA